MHKHLFLTKFSTSFSPNFIARIYIYTKSYKNQAATEASFRITKIIAQKKEPYEDAEMIQVAFMEAANNLFSNFSIKDEILFAIELTG